MAIDGNGEHDDHYILVIDSRFQIIQPSPSWRRRSAAQPKPTTGKSTNLPAFSRDLRAALSAWEVPQLEAKAEAGEGTVPSNPGPERRLSNSTRKANLTMLPKIQADFGSFPSKKKRIQTGHQNWLGIPRHKKYSLIMNHTCIINIFVMDMYILYIHEYVCLLIYILCIPYACFTQ